MGTDRIRELEEQIAELRAIWPGHPMSPSKRQEELEELEEELERLRKQVE